MTTRSLLFALLLAAACGPRSATDDENAGMHGGIDTSRDGLTRFVREGRYKEWTSEPALHDSAGPHKSKVRVFFNETLVASLKAGNAVHPPGSAVVKELFDGDGAPAGHAIDVKVAEGSGPETWIFYEGFTLDYEDPYYGRAHETCHGCHQPGRDYVLSPLPK